MGKRSTGAQSADPMVLKKSVEDLRKLLELRRSSASSPVRNKKKYTRKRKHRRKYESS
jgi:hypothetical protein